MTKHKFPPRGYEQMEYPLPHQFEYQFGLSPETATKNSTIIPILRSSEGNTAVDTIEVNPSHSAFAEETGTLIHPDSIVPQMNISMTAQMNHGLDETDKIRYLKFHWMPIYLAFEDMYLAKENETNLTVADILELTTSSGNKAVTPTYNNVKLLVEEDWPMSTINQAETFSIAGMDTDIKGEGVTFDPELMWDTLNHGSNAGMLAKAMGQWHTELLDVRRPWIRNSNNFTHPTIKRGNEFTFCGILFHVPLTGTSKQYYKAADITEAGSTINFSIQVRYDEWNAHFDQTAF